jgi:hypothetical protein
MCGLYPTLQVGTTQLTLVVKMNVIGHHLYYYLFYENWHKQ